MPYGYSLNRRISVNRCTTAIKTNYVSRKTSEQKSTSSETKYLEKKGTSGISLYTHIRTLLEMFIFQNPVQPIRYFEYYSERLKESYQRPQTNRDLDFLYNIDSNVHKKIADIYYDITKNREPIPDHRASDMSFDDDVFDVEYENEYEVGDGISRPVELEEITVQDLSRSNYMFNKAGCGIRDDEANLIEMTMDQMSRLGKFKNIRYWGKILGTKNDYYILECEWQNKELEYKLRLINHMLNMKNKDVQKLIEYDSIYENEEEVELEKSLGSIEQVEDELGFPTKSSPQIVYNKEIVEQSTQDLNQNELKSTCAFPTIKSSSTDDHLSYELYGFGANRKSYFVTNQLSGEWVELPLLKPHHVIQSRSIKKYFVGDLESPVDSYPQFQGLEKHYLRAQIARITAATHISPLKFYLFGNEDEGPSKWRKLNRFQSKVYEQKWIHDFTENPSYDPLSVYALLEPENWIHHTPMISGQGVTHAWSRIVMSENNTKENKNKNRKALDNFSNFHLVNGERPDIVLNLSDDVYLDNISPWKFELTNPFDHRSTYVSTKSNIWPGAFTVTRENLLGYTYYGWGHKWKPNSFTPLVMDLCGEHEYPNGQKNVTEMADPTYEEETNYVEQIQQVKQGKNDAKFTAMKRYEKVEGVDEDEERVIKEYDFD